MQIECSKPHDDLICRLLFYRNPEVLEKVRCFFDVLAVEDIERVRLIKHALRLPYAPWYSCKGEGLYVRS